MTWSLSAEGAGGNHLLTGREMPKIPFSGALLFVLAALPPILFAKDVPKKYIFASWERGDVTPQEILAHVDAFDRTGCDGVSYQLRAVLPGATPQRPRRIMEKPLWTDEELDSLAPVFRKLAEHPSMRHSFFGVNTSPRVARFRWDDDEAWGVFAANMATLARFARKVGVPGYGAVKAKEKEDWYKRTGAGWCLAHEISWRHAKAQEKLLEDWGWRRPDTKVWNYWDEDSPIPLRAKGLSVATLAMSRADGECLLVVSNAEDSGGKVALTVDRAKMGLRKGFGAVDLETGSKAAVSGDTVELELDGDDYAIIALR